MNNLTAERQIPRDFRFRYDVNELKIDRVLRADVSDMTALHKFQLDMLEFEDETVLVLVYVDASKTILPLIFINGELSNRSKDGNYDTNL